MSASIFARMAEDLHCLHATARTAGESCTQFRARMLAEPASHCYNCNCHSALEAAQQEAEAWEAIEAWSKARHGSYDSGYSVAGRNFPACWRFELHTPGTNAMGRSSSGSLFGATRLEALTKAAAWCRAKLQRADQP